jgi:hypothetical protein
VAITHDANGNMVYDGRDQTFEWDAANRLGAINYLDTNKRSEFAYDGLGHRIKITEYGPGVTAIIQPSGSSYSAFSTAPFTLPAGGYTLTFQGLNPNGGDNTAFVDSVALNASLVPNGGFENPTVTDYETAPPEDTAWIYGATSGIAANGGTYNPSTSAGSQVAFIENSGLLSQIWSASAGIYTLSFSAAQRAAGNDSHQQLRVSLRPSGSPVAVKTFVWCPLNGAETSRGPNLYGYAGDDPINLTDQSGLAFGDYWDVRASAAFYRNLTKTTENPWAAAGAALANATFTFWGVEALQENAERAGQAAGAECPGRAWGYGGLVVGQIILAFGLADVAFLGREFSIGEEFRVAPLGNRTTSEFGTLPHYHRRIVGPDGETIPGGSMSWHRPWEKGL